MTTYAFMVANARVGVNRRRGETLLSSQPCRSTPHQRIKFFWSTLCNAATLHFELDFHHISANVTVWKLRVCASSLGSRAYHS
jgi:hypothetical protein